MAANDEHYDVIVTHIRYSDNVIVPLIFEKACVTSDITESSGLIAIKLSNGDQIERMVVTLLKMKEKHYTITIESQNWDYTVTSDTHGKLGKFTIALSNEGEVGVWLSCRCGNAYESLTYQY